MPTTNFLLDTPAPGPYLALSALTTTWAAPPHQPPGLLHLDCSAALHTYPLGVCHQVSLLLLLRRAGVEIWLHQVNPVLRHSLHQLQVANLFAWGA